MTKRYEMYKCEICGNIVEILHGGKGELYCCQQPMKLMEIKKEEQGYEKHLPVIEKQEGKTIVKVGSVTHPMEEKHYIELIEVITPDDKILRKYLKPGDEPKAEFNVEKIKIAREYCTIHEVWAKEM